jgi:protein-tyrosine-phosphatase
MKIKKILFVCKHNRFRSKVAEAAFNKYNKNRNIKAVSGGLFTGKPPEKNVIDIGEKYGLKINNQSKPIKDEDFRSLDLVVIVANNVPASLFKGKVKKVIVWKIPDTTQDNKKRIEEITKQIIIKVQDLIKWLEKGK